MIACVVAPLLDELFPRDQVRVVAEPGRFFCTAPFALVVSVTATRVRYRKVRARAPRSRLPPVHDDASASDLRSATATALDDSIDASRDEQVTVTAKNAKSGSFA
jgi:diaminopimelate decarboxylase